MRILVTGASGFVGRSVLMRLASAGYPLRAMLRTGSSGVRLPELVQTCIGDLSQPDTLDACVTDIDTVVHAAAALGGSSESELRHVNVQGTSHIAGAAARAGVRRFVHLSSAGVYGDRPRVEPMCESADLLAAGPYERSKLEGERALVKALESSRTQWVVLRPGGIYGSARPMTREFLNQVRHRRLWIHVPPRVMLHPTHIDDVLQAILAVLGDGTIAGDVFNVGGSRSLWYDEWVSVTAAMLKSRNHQWVVPAGLCRAPAALVVRLLQAAGRSTGGRIARARLATVSRVLDTSKARARLGLRPLELQDALSRTVAEFLESSGGGVAA